MDLMDDSGQIRMTVFGESVDKFYEMIEVTDYTLYLNGRKNEKRNLITFLQILVL